MTAYELKNGWALIGTDGRISGTWVVLMSSAPGARIWIRPHEVTVYDEARRSGIVLYSGDLQASVRDGKPSIDRIAERWQYDVEDVEHELYALIVEIAERAADVEIRRQS